jgi:hypothetical protein
MKIIEKSTGTEIGSIVTNRSLTLDEAMGLIGYPWVNDEDSNESGYKVDDVYYDESDLEMDYDD